VKDADGLGKKVWHEDDGEDLPDELIVEARLRVIRHKGDELHGVHGVPIGRHGEVNRRLWKRCGARNP